MNQLNLLLGNPLLHNRHNIDLIGGDKVVCFELLVIPEFDVEEEARGTGEGYGFVPGGLCAALITD